MRVGYMKSIPADTKESIGNMMEAAGVKKIVIEHDLEDNKTQIKLLELIDRLSPRDIIVTINLDQLGDNLIDIINIIKKIDENDLGIYFLEEPFKPVNSKNWELSRLLRKQFLALLIWANNKQQNEYRSLQNRGINVVRSQKKAGRPRRYAINAEKKEDRDKYLEVVNLLNNNVPILQIREITGLGRNTIYYIKEELEKIDKEKNRNNTGED